MLRAIAYLIATVLIITLLRSVIGVLLKGVQELFRAGDAPPKSRNVPTGGELKKDPVCGTFISAETAMQKRVGAATYYFCSVECRDKFKS
jgi:YHS domain-containing protein